MAEVNTPVPGGQFVGATTDRGRNPGGRFSGDGIADVANAVLSDTILWIGTNVPTADQFILWINTEDGRWYGKWNDGDSTQWVDLSLPFGEGQVGPRGIQGERGLTGEPGEGIPTGGAAEEILVKTDGTDYNTYWGARPADGLNLLNGSGAPDDVADGVDGEFYLDTSATELYGPKAGGAWPAPVSLIGPQGDAVEWITQAGAPVDVSDGEDGDMYLNTTTWDVYGPKAAGAWGASVGNIKGADGAGVPVGGTAAQLLSKIDGTDYNAQWVDAPVALPAGGTLDQILSKDSATDGDATWKDPAAALPAGGTANQLLIKQSATDGDATWNDAPDGLPAGGTLDQILSKDSATDGDATWKDPETSVPDGGTANQVLAKASATDGDVEWQTVASGGGLPAGGATGSVLTKQSATDDDADWEVPVAGSNPVREGFRAYKASSTSGSGVHTIIMDTVDFDTENAFSTVNGRFTVPASLDGKWMIFTFNYRATSSPTATGYMYYKNSGGTTLAEAQNASVDSRVSMAIGPIQVATGDYIYPSMFGSLSSQAGRVVNFAGCVVDSGGSQGSVTTTLNQNRVAANISSTQSAGIGDTIIDWTNLILDETSSHSSGVFTMPDGMPDSRLHVSCGTLHTADASGSVNTFIEVSRDSGSTWDIVAESPNGGVDAFGVTNAAAIVDVEAGDQVRIRHNNSGAKTLDTSGDRTFLNMHTVPHTFTVAPSTNTDDVSGTTYSTTDEDFLGNKIKTCTNSSGCVVTVDTTTNTEAVVFIREGSGDLTFAAGTGVTLKSAGSNLKVNLQYGSAAIIPDALNADTFYIIGDLKA